LSAGLWGIGGRAHVGGGAGGGPTICERLRLFAALALNDMADASSVLDRMVPRASAFADDDDDDDVTWRLARFRHRAAPAGLRPGDEPGRASSRMPSVEAHRTIVRRGAAGRVSNAGTWRKCDGSCTVCDADGDALTGGTGGNDSRVGMNLLKSGAGSSAIDETDWLRRVCMLECLLGPLLFRVRSEFV